MQIICSFWLLSPTIFDYKLQSPHLQPFLSSTHSTHSSLSWVSSQSCLPCLEPATKVRPVCHASLPTPPWSPSTWTRDTLGGALRLRHCPMVLIPSFPVSHPVLLESSLGWWSAVYRPFPKSLLTPPRSAPGNSLLLPFKDVFLPVWTVSLSLVCLLEPDLTMSPNYTCQLLSPASSNLFPIVDSDSIKPDLHMVLKWSHPPKIAWMCKVIFSAVGGHLIWFSLVDFCE